MTIHRLTQGINQTTTQYLNKAGAGFNKAGNWLEKGITEISKSFHHIGAKIGPTAEKATTVVSNALKSPYFQGLLIVGGVAVMGVFAKELWDSRNIKFSFIHHGVFAIGLVAGIALATVGIALAVAKL
jgi:hypothetical protein